MFFQVCIITSLMLLILTFFNLISLTIPDLFDLMWFDTPSPSSHTSNTGLRTCRDPPPPPTLHLSSRRPGGDAGKRFVIFNLHMAVTGSSGLSADVIRAWGPLWPPGVWEDFSLSGAGGWGGILPPWWEHYHCWSALMNVGRHFCVHVCVWISCKKPAHTVFLCSTMIPTWSWMTAAKHYRDWN